MTRSKPIWEDWTFRFSGRERNNYTINIGGKEVYKGVAIARPDGKGEIKVNDIVAGYLKQAIPDKVGEPSLISTLQRDFVLITEAGVNGATLRLDWSYDETFNPDDYTIAGVLSAPINGRVRKGQYLILTHINDTSLFYDFGDGKGTTILYPKSDYNLALRIPKNATKAVAGHLTFKLSEGCEDYCLYYVNEYGGWDSFLIGGNSINTDDYRRMTFRKEYDNKVGTNAGKEVYLNEITKVWELHTGWLTGDEGSRMHHLLGSTMVYLHDLKKDTIVPVIITDTQCRYKTYHNNGNQLVDYTINVEVARDYRRQ